jgi:hypothetical protein
LPLTGPATGRAASSDAKPYAADRASWAALAQPAVTVSDNDATAELWSRVGGRQLLTSIKHRTGVAWKVDHDGEDAALRLLITADELAQAYAVFAADSSDVAVQLRAWMRAVPPAQTFGVREVACDILGVSAAEIAVKCGWFGVERAHAVTIVELHGRTLGSAVTAFRPQGATNRAMHDAARGSDAKMIAAHDEAFGSFVRAATRRALWVAAAL